MAKTGGGTSCLKAIQLFEEKTGKKATGSSTPKTPSCLLLLPLLLVLLPGRYGPETKRPLSLGALGIFPL